MTHFDLTGPISLSASELSTCRTRIAQLLLAIPSLRQLKLAGCNQLRRLTQNELTSLSSLTALDLHRCAGFGFAAAIVCTLLIVSCKHAHDPTLSHSSGIERLPEDITLPSLCTLDLSWCTRLQQLPEQGFPGLCKLTWLDLSRCFWYDMMCPVWLVLFLSMFVRSSALKTLPKDMRLPGLHHLILADCKLTAICEATLSNLQNLVTLNLAG